MAWEANSHSRSARVSCSSETARSTYAVFYRYECGIQDERGWSMKSRRYLRIGVAALLAAAASLMLPAQPASAAPGCTHKGCEGQSAAAMGCTVDGYPI